MKERMTAIPEDGMINVDGQVLFFAYEAPYPVRVVQWRNGAGQLEFEDVTRNVLFGVHEYEEYVAPFAALWEAEKARLDEIANRPPTLEQARAAALETLRLRKWQAKDAGITVNGIAIDTDDKGQSTIMGAVLNVMIDPTFTAMWKTSAVDEHGQSVWVEIDAMIIMALSKAMTQYTEACFAVEAMKQAEIAACGTVAEINAWLEASLDTGWPDREITLGG